jgi:hypothetical protein
VEDGRKVGSEANFAFAHHVSDTPPAECHDIAKKKEILEEMPENEMSQYTVVVTYNYLRKLQMTQRTY